MGQRGRPKNFDPEQKLEVAMELFWKQGYEGTSLNDLLNNLEISRQSLYNTYGDKHTLFEKCLDHYTEKTEQLLKGTLLRPNSGLDTIKQLFEMYIDITAFDSSKKSCFMANASMEMALHDAMIKSKVKDFFKLTEKAFHNALTNAINRGEFKSEKDPSILASYLTSSMMGIGILSKAGMSNERIKNVFEIIFIIKF